MMRFFETRGVRLRRLASVRCIACDLDGTLLTRTNEIHPDVVEMVAKVRERGIRIILASGRSDTFTRRYARQIGSTSPVISLNGALVKDSEGSVLFSSPLASEVCAKADEVSLHPESEGLSWSLFTPDGIVSLEEAPVLPRYLRSEKQDIIRVGDLRPYHTSTVLLCAGGGYRAVQKLSVAIARRHGRRLQRSMYQSGSGQDLFYLEVRNRNITKAVGLKHVLDAMDIERRQCAAIGDYSNDVEMCTFAGVSAAMLNGIQELKLVTDYVTRLDNDEGGVAEFLRIILEGRIR
ncbi:MAG: HAD hydrolase family protein [Bacteroidetes bacterium]|nr:HAD hydrolase family protein [Bacteroidota bacterium]